LKLKYDKVLSSFAFKFNLRRYTKVCFVLARMTAVHETNTRKNETLTFVDFMDALARAAEVGPGITQMQLHM
jgi:hypothetical protein